MPKYICKHGEDGEPFLEMEAEGPWYKPTVIKALHDSAGGPASYARDLAEHMEASARAIASRLGWDVVMEKAEGDESVEKTDNPGRRGLEEAIAKARRRRQGTGTSAVELSAAGEIAKADDEQRNVFGWAYVTHDREGNVNVDKSGDFIDAVEEIEKSAYDFVLNSRNADADHTNVKGGTLVESIVFTPEKIEKMGLPQGAVPYGWWLGFHIEDERTWDRVKKGELRAFSIHGKGTRKSVDDK